jgi:hypothetical protein
MNLTLMTPTSVDQLAYRQHSRESRVSPAARAVYSRFVQTGWIRRLLAKVPALKDLHQVLEGRQVYSRYSDGLQLVAISQIRGSEGRSEEFDAEFHPVKTHTQYRWLRVATAHDEGISLPPVELIRYGGEYYVRDGHHRISVALARGQKDIEAVVTVWEAK